MPDPSDFSNSANIVSGLFKVRETLEEMKVAELQELNSGRLTIEKRKEILDIISDINKGLSRIPERPKAAPLPKEIPEGSVEMGTLDGGVVYKTPDGRRLLFTPDPGEQPPVDDIVSSPEEKKEISSVDPEMGDLIKSVGGEKGEGKKKGLDVLAKAEEEFPLLRKMRENGDLQYDIAQTPKGKDDGILEFYAGDETGSKEHPRPKNWKNGVPGVQLRNLDSIKPSDVMGDVVSHHLIHTDPVIKDIYAKFKDSITPRQEEILQEKYEYAKKNFNEDRPFGEWLEISGMPGHFRAYPFRQWGDDIQRYNAQYTADQMKMLDKMMGYVKDLGGSGSEELPVNKGGNRAKSVVESDIEDISKEIVKFEKFVEENRKKGKKFKRTKFNVQSPEETLREMKATLSGLRDELKMSSRKSK